MRYLLNNLIEYQKLHPLRFWGAIFAVVFLIIIISFLIYKKANSSKPKTKKGAKRKKSSKQKRKSTFKNNFLWPVFILFFSSLIAGVLYFNYKYNNTNYPENPFISDTGYIFGIDISAYQGKINWKKVQTSKHPIKFIFVRATMGSNGKDRYFKYNWKNIKKYHYVRGAYHYYRPNENSTTQFNNYSSVISNNEKNFIPILDVEKQSFYSKENLRKGVLNWLKLAEEYYGVKPVIYTGLTFYLKNLKGYINDYPLWIAAYSGEHRVKNIDWDFYQFTEKVYVKGIKTNVDGNNFKGSIKDLKALCK